MNWEDIKTAKQVVLCGNIRRAGKTLGIHHTTVIRRINGLENKLRAKLFNRTPNGLEPTRAGQILFDFADDFTEKLIVIERTIMGLDEELSGPLKVTLPEPLLNAVFLPVLASFVDKYPNIDLHFDTSLSIRDVARKEADIAVRLHNAPPDSLVGKRLFAYTETAYATADYLREKRQKFRWIGWRRETEDVPNWVKATEFPEAPVFGVFPTIAAQQSAAREGFGLAMLPCFFGDADSKLVRATSRLPTKSRDVWLLTHADLQNTAKVKAFMRFAEDALRARRCEFEGALSDN